MGTVQVEILKLGLEGQGVAQGPDRRVFFVKEAYPGDIVEVEYSPAGRRYQDVDLKKIVTPSPLRKESDCEYFRQCGGCDFLDVDYATQLQFKETILKHHLDKLSLNPKTLLPIIPAEAQWYYRNRVQIRKMNSSVGFLRKKTHQLIDINECKIAHPKINEAIKNLRSEPVGHAMQKIELSFNSETQQVEKKYEDGPGTLGFTQVHSEQNEKLKALVASFILEHNPSKSVLELYCGNGNLSFEFLNQVDWFCGIDSHAGMIAEANSKIVPASSKKSFAKGNLNWHPRKIAKAYEGCYDTLLVDPPRQGMYEALKYFVSDSVKKLVYVSCSPLTFIQDVQLIKKHFQFDVLQPIDMFPQTRHFELVALFSR